MFDQQQLNAEIGRRLRQLGPVGQALIDRRITLRDTSRYVLASGTSIARLFAHELGDRARHRLHR